MFSRFGQGAVAVTAPFEARIADLAVGVTGGGTFLYGTTGRGGGLVAYALHAGVAAALHDVVNFPASLTDIVGDSILQSSLGGVAQLSIATTSGSGVTRYALTETGQFGAVFSGAGPAGPVQQITALTESGAIAYVADAASGQITGHVIEADGSLGAMRGGIAAQAVALEAVDWQGVPLLLVADGAAQGVTLLQVSPGTGALTMRASMGAAQGLGVNTPTAMDVVQAHGAAWVVLASAGSNSLSVMRLTGTDGLTPTEHVIDTRETRFGNVQALEVVKVGEHVFVLAGGGDDGLSLFTLLPDGRLVHLKSIAAGPDLALFNISAITAVQVGDEVQIFVGSQAGPGLTQITLPLSDLGEVIRGDGIDAATLTGTAGDDLLTAGTGVAVLHGGAGDDILVAGTGSGRLEGGTGADTFVMRAGSGPTAIADFERGQDHLDVSDYMLLRNPDQLTVTPTATGAQIRFFNELIDVTASNRAPLTSAEIFGQQFTTPDRLLLFSDAPPPDAPPPDPPASGSTTGPGLISITAGSPNPALHNADLRLTDPDGNVTMIRADPLGVFTFDVPPTPGTHLEIIRDLAVGDPAISAVDALQVLRLAVGLPPTWGPTLPEDFIAADINRDGRVTALDALDVLRHAVGLATSHTPQWIFLDPGADFSGADRSHVPQDSGIILNGLAEPFDISMTAILLGNMEFIG